MVDNEEDKAIEEPKKEENTKISAEELKKIKYYIENCQGREEWKEVIKIVRKNLNKYTENSNGSFLNLSILDVKTLNDIKYFIKFCKDNQQYMNKNNQKIEDEKQRLTTLFEETEYKDEITNSDIFNNTNVSNNKTYDIYSMSSLQSSIFEEYKMPEENFTDNDIDENDMIGLKINLKKNKKKYSGIKAKILKRYKDISKNSAVSCSVKVTTKKTNKKQTTKKILKKDYKAKQDSPTELEGEEDDDDDDEDDEEDVEEED